MKKTYTDQEKFALVERYYNGESVANICLETGIARSTFYTWLKPYQTTKTNAENAVSAFEFVKMKKRIEKLEQMIEVLQRVNCTQNAPLKEKLKELALLHGQYSIHVLCEALNVSRGTFYNHIFRNKKDNTSYQIRRTQLSDKIKQIYEDSNQIFGSKKIQAILSAQGEKTSVKMVSDLMQEMNLFSIRASAKKNYDRNYEKKKDILKMDFSVKAPNEVWVSDVTYFKLDKKFHYICVILDLYSRKVIAYKISSKHSAQLITSTFKLAYTSRQPQEGMVFHSDRGTQYTSYTFQKLLKSLNLKQSFSPTGKPHHNAVMESFFSSMKKEELYRANYHSFNELKQRIEDYINFYNTKRPHATLDYKTPDTHERLYYERTNRKTN